MTEKESEEPIYEQTNTSYTVPQLNEGVPPDPTFMRVLSAVEVAIEDPLPAGLNRFLSPVDRTY